MINGRIAAVHEIERLVARLGLTREHRGDVIEKLTGHRTLVKVDGHQLVAVREHLEQMLRDRPAPDLGLEERPGVRMRPDGTRFGG